MSDNGPVTLALTGPRPAKRSPDTPLPARLFQADPKSADGEDTRRSSLGFLKLRMFPLTATSLCAILPLRFPVARLFEKRTLPFTEPAV
jgi:hypothetical protein